MDQYLQKYIEYYDKKAEQFRNEKGENSAEELFNLQMAGFLEELQTLRDFRRRVMKAVN